MTKFFSKIITNNRIFIFILLLQALSVSAQVKVTGRVINLKNMPVADVIIKCVSEGKTLAFTSTNAQGQYTLELKDMPKQAVELQFSHISYEKENVELTITEKATEQNMVLTDKQVTLKEVKVQAKPIIFQGDTLSYNLASFLGKGDVTLEDGLKRLPGIDVTDNGTIKYLGKAISHFYIEGMDMLGGKYNLATKNIPAEYATQVDVMKHHKHRKIDADEESDDVAINVKLSNKAKFKPFGQPAAGIGLREDDLLYALGLTGMMFTDNFQLLGSAKGSNHGNFGSYDIIDHFGNSDISTLATDKLGKWNSARPPLGEYLYQTNAYASLNGIEKMDSDRQVRMNADYAYEDYNSSSSTNTLYFADGQNISINEENRPHTRLHRPMIEARYENNGNDRYFMDRVNMKAQFEENECPVIATDVNNQNRKATQLAISNYLASTVRMGENKLSFNSSIGFTRAPKVCLNMNSISQTGQSTTITTDNSTSFTIRLGSKWRISLPVNLTAYYNMIETSLHNPNDAIQSQRIDGWVVTPWASPSTDWRSPSGKIYISIGANLQWRNMMYRNHQTEPLPSGRMGGGRTTMSELFAEPRLSFRYTFSGTSEMSFHSAIYNSVGDILDLLTTPVQTNYRTTNAASGVIGKNQVWASSLSYTYQIPFSYFTLTADAGWTQGKRNVLSSQYVDEESTSTASIFRDSHTKNANANLSISKNLLTLSTKLQFTASGSWGSSESMSQGKVVTTYGNSYTFKGQATVTPLSWMEIGANGQYSRNYTWWTGNHRTTDGENASLSLSVFPIDKIEIKSSYDFVRSQITDNQYKNFSLLSASVQYKASRAVWKLSLNNLLNTRHYRYTTFNATDRYTMDCHLIGRTIMLTCKLNLVKK